MTAAIVLVALAAVAGVSIVSVVLSRQAREGWLHAGSVQREVRNLLIARVTTLENRLLAHNWQDFANLQHLPDEIAKAAWAEAQQRAPESFGETAGEMLQERLRHEGIDLEGDLFEGSTIG